MTKEINFIPELTSNNVIDPNSFDVTITALLIGIGADKYIEIFRKNNIGQCTLIELCDEDLIKFGVDDETIRSNLLKEVKNLPLYEETKLSKSLEPNIETKEIINILEESTQHLYRIYLSMMTNTLALKKANVVDSIICNDKYASNVAITTLSHMTNILNSMDIALHTQAKVLSKKSSYLRTKKVVVGTVGSAAVAVLSLYFVRSLKTI